MGTKLKILLVLFLFLESFLLATEPNDLYGSYSSVNVPIGSNVRGSTTVLDRDGTDGGHITVNVRSGLVYSCVVESVPQGGAGATISMEIGDVFVVWDEDPTHGSNEYFSCVPSNMLTPGAPDYVTVWGDPNTNWVTRTAIAEGTITIPPTGTGENEHDAIHLQRYSDVTDFDKDDGITDPNACVEQHGTIEYEISIYNNSGESFENVTVVDWLPWEVDYPAGFWHMDPNTWDILPPDPNYDVVTHTYTWTIGNMPSTYQTTLTLDVSVNDYARPGMELYNIARMLQNEDTILAVDFEVTKLCCWNIGTLYVDSTATGDHTGLDWENAFTDLGDALNFASESLSNCPDCIDTIYVAQGMYDPNYTPDLTFVIPTGIAMYGGFPLGGCDFQYRNPRTYKTTLTGLIDNDAFPDVDVLVKMGNNTILDGFTVTQTIAPTGKCVYGKNADFEITDCMITHSGGYGIYAVDGNDIVNWCNISLNGRTGIRQDGQDHTLTVNNCWLLRNGRMGIDCENSTLTAKNSIISESDLTELGYAGIRLYRPTYSSVLQNLTIANNKSYGVYFEDDHDINNDPNTLDYPEMQNCIVYYNNSGGLQLNAKLNPDTVAHYSCIQDCNEIQGVTTNYNHVPEFAYEIDPYGTPDPNNYHLAADSFCKEKGNQSLSYTSQVDMDNDERLYGTFVDIGADEVQCTDVSNNLDWNADGLVNYIEFSAFAQAWLSHDPDDPTPPDPNDTVYWNPLCNLDATENTDTEYVIDLADLKVFVNDTPWLWEACWKGDGLSEMMMSGGGENLLMAMPLMENVILESPVELNSYDTMSSTEFVLFVKGIYEVIDSIETTIDQEPTNAEDLRDAQEFLKSVLSDLKASKQESLDKTGVIW